MESPRFENQSDAEAYITYLKDEIIRLYDSNSHPESGLVSEEWCNGYASAVEDIMGLLKSN